MTYITYHPTPHPNLNPSTIHPIPQSNLIQLIHPQTSKLPSIHPSIQPASHPSIHTKYKNTPSLLSHSFTYRPATSSSTLKSINSIHPNHPYPHPPTPTPSMRLKPAPSHPSLTVHHHEPHARTAHPPIQSTPAQPMNLQLRITREQRRTSQSLALTRRVITTVSIRSICRLLFCFCFRPLFHSFCLGSRCVCRHVCVYVCVCVCVCVCV